MVKLIQKNKINTIIIENHFVLGLANNFLTGEIIITIKPITLLIKNLG